MGSGVSSELKPPKNYDKKNFQKILSLYDKLDSNGNMVIEQEELYILANHHIKNKKLLIQQEKMKNDTEIKSRILALNLKYENDKKELENNHKSQIEKLKQK